MSLINDVLRNLEANRPDALVAQNLQREIRSLPAAPPARNAFRLFLLSGLLLAVGAAAWTWHGRLDQMVVLDAPLPTPVVPAPRAAGTTEVAAGVISENLILAQELLSLPPARATEPGVPLPVTPEPAAVAAGPSLLPAASVPPGKATQAPVVAPSLPAKVEVPTAATVQPASANIEKIPVMATPRDRADAEWRRAEAAFAGGRGDEGRAALRGALRHDPAHLQARQALLRNLLEVRKIDEAVSVLQEGLELQPAQAGWAMSLARLQLEQGDLAAADRTLVRSQGFAEGNADYAGFQGHIKSRLGAHRQAAAHYQRATRLAPNDGRWWLGYGLAMESDGRLPEGREALRRALAAGNLTGELAAVAEQHLR